MKRQIAVIDSSSKITGILKSISPELDLITHGFYSAGDFADSLNRKTLQSNELSAIIICLINSSSNNSEIKTCINLSKKIKKNSKLATLPLLIIGPDNTVIHDSCSGSCNEYLTLPVTKRILSETVLNYCLNSYNDNTQTAIADSSAAVVFNNHYHENSKPEENKELKLNNESLSNSKINKTRTESERRIATVMFADISGFTAMSEKLDPEEVTRIMNLCFKTLGNCIESHGGYIDKFIGDCIMAVFGVPKALENAPLQAVNTAVDIRNTLYSFNKLNNLAIPLDIHIGINTGIVLSGVVGSNQKMDYTVMGDTVNLASRLEDASEKGQILTGIETFRATRNNFEYRELKPVTLKGKAEPVPVYELLSYKETPATRALKSSKHITSMTDRIIFSELVGRNDEMNRLRLNVMKVLNGNGGIVNITGEAGIGKSRLLAELINDPAVKQVTLLEGRSISIGRNLSYHPIIDLLKKWANISEDDTQQSSLIKLDKSIRAIYPEEADEITPFIATLMGLNLTGEFASRVKGIEGEALENLILKNIRELLIKSSEHKPLVIYMEDLHWADASTIELLESLLPLAEKYRILFINAFRPGYSDTGDRITRTIAANSSKIYSEIKLDPLEDGESEKLIANLLNIKGLPQKLEEQIKERSGGNPFFIEEVVRSFIDDGAVVLKNGSSIITDRINNFNVPMTINEVLMSRIDRLDEETRNLVKTASVIGRNFFHKIIIQVADNISNIDSKLNYLEDIQLIRERNRMDELEYLFKHALIQETAYESLLLQRRKELHLNVAMAIENIFVERLHEFYGMLAFHYSMGEDLDKSEEYMLKAGEEALKSSASSEALTYFNQALDIYQMKNSSRTEPLKLADMERKIGMAYMNKGLLVEALQSFQRSLTYYGEKKINNRYLEMLRLLYNIFFITITIYVFPNKKKLKMEDAGSEIYLIHLYMGKILTVISPRQMFIDTIDSCRKLLKYDACKSQLVFNTMSGTSLLFFFTGISFRIGSKIMEQIKSYLPEIDESIKAYLYYNTQKVYDYQVGNWTKDYDDRPVDEALSFGDTWSAATYLVYQLRILVASGYFDDAEIIITKINDIGDKFNDEYCRSQFYLSNATYSFFKRDIRNGLCYMDEGIIHIYKMRQSQITIAYTGIMASLLILNNDINQAEKLIDKGNDIISREKHFIPHFYYTFINAIFLLNLFKLKESIKINDEQNIKAYRKKTFEAARKAVKTHKNLAIYRTEAYKNMGEYYWITGEYKKAFKWWRKAVECGIKLNARTELSRTYFEIAKSLKTLDLNLTSNSLSRAITLKQKKKNEKLYRLAKKIIGHTHEECLNKAETMFREMNLEWDLEQVKEYKHI